MVNDAGFSENQTKEKMSLTQLGRACKEKGIRMKKEKYILFGEGVVFDAEHNLVIISENVTDEDISLAVEYLERI